MEHLDLKLQTQLIELLITPQLTMFSKMFNIKYRWSNKFSKIIEAKQLIDQLYQRIETQ